jgi:sec-independent protein translocase protein TatA
LFNIYDLPEGKISGKNGEVNMLGGLGWPELLIIAVIVLVIFGAGKLPEIGGGIGKAIRGFKDAVKGAPEEAPSKGLKTERKASQKAIEAKEAPVSPDEEIELSKSDDKQKKKINS